MLVDVTCDSLWADCMGLLSVTAFRERREPL